MLLSLHSNESKFRISSRIYVREYEEGEDYAIFTVNEHVTPSRAQVLVGQYGQRLEIENQYKSIKEHFLPKTCSSDYRPRFLYFIIGVVLYNVGGCRTSFSVTVLMWILVRTRRSQLVK